MPSIRDKNTEEILVDREIARAHRDSTKRTRSKYDRRAEAELARERAEYLPAQRRAIREQRR